MSSHHRMRMDEWASAPVRPDFGFNHVDVWRIFLKLQADSVKKIESALSVDETERAGRFHFPIDRDRFIAAHAGLRDILARYLSCQPRELVFSVNQYGQPALDDHKLEFNLSHSADFALIAISQHRVGVDVERIRSDMELENIASRFFSKNEISELMALPAEQRVAGFFNCWTRKEAYIKAHGLGLSLPLESFDVSLKPNEPAILRATRPDPQEAAHWALCPLRVDPGYAAALAVDGENLQLRLWDWNK